MPARPTRLRWLAPVLAAALAAGVATVPRLADAADPDALPPRSAAALLASVARAEVPALSGTVVQTSRLGLPDLPRDASGSTLSLPDLLGGSTTARVWRAGDRSRLAVDADFGELDVVRDGREVWTWDSAGSRVTHLVLPDDDAAAPAPAVDPLAAARTVLDLVDDTTGVAVGTSAVVAGRAAYELVLTPRDPATLVRSVRVAVDGATSVPLRVQVLAAGSAEPAVEVGFTQVRFAAPDDDVLSFRPPAGVRVEERTLPGRPSGAAHRGPAVQVLGSGWSSVLSVPLAGVRLPEDRSLLDAVTTPVPQGRLLRSALVSALLTDDGRLLVGAVPPARLQAVAAGR